MEWFHCTKGSLYFFRLLKCFSHFFKKNALLKYPLFGTFIFKSVELSQVTIQDATTYLSNSDASGLH